MPTYTVTTTFGDSFRFTADFSRADSQLFVLSDDDVPEDDGMPVPYQVADARHDETEAAVLLIKYFGRDWWLDPSTHVEDEDEDDYIRGLIVSITEG